MEDEKEADEKLRAKEKERERERAMQNFDPRKSDGLAVCSASANPTLAIYLDSTRNPKCKECNSTDIDHMFKKVFGCLVCNKCKNEFPEKYSLLTKTECKEVSNLTSDIHST